MEMGVGMANNAQAEIAAADHPQIRLLMVPNRFTPQPMTDIEENPNGHVREYGRDVAPQSVSEGGWKLVSPGLRLLLCP